MSLMFSQNPGVEHPTGLHTIHPIHPKKRIFQWIQIIFPKAWAIEVCQWLINWLATHF